MSSKTKFKICQNQTKSRKDLIIITTWNGLKCDSHKFLLENVHTVAYIYFKDIYAS